MEHLEHRVVLQPVHGELPPQLNACLKQKAVRMFSRCREARDQRPWRDRLIQLEQTGCLFLLVLLLAKTDFKATTTATRPTAFRICCLVRNGFSATSTTDACSCCATCYTSHG